MLNSSLLRFLVVGVLNTTVGLGSIFLLKLVAGFDDVAANISGYCLGLCVSFLLNRRWTFAHDGAWLPAMFRFLVVFGVAYAANLITMLFLRDVVGINSYLCHLLSMLPYTALFYLGSRTFAFRRTADPAVR